MPEEERYDGYLQLENGVGMTRLLLEEFKDGMQKLSEEMTLPDESVAEEILTLINSDEFKIEENQSTIRTEIIAGITTFFAMCYIILVNPSSMSGANAGPIWNACFVGGIIGAVVATVCMAFIANKPFCLAAGMGLNSFFFVSFILPNILLDSVAGYQAGLAVILLSSIV